MARGSVPGSNRATASRTPKAPAKGRSLRSMRIARAKGGYVANHEYEGSGQSWEPGEEHVIAGGPKELVAHVQKHFAADETDTPARSNRQESMEQAG